MELKELQSELVKIQADNALKVKAMDEKVAAAEAKGLELDKKAQEAIDLAKKSGERYDDVMRALATANLPGNDPNDKKGVNAAKSAMQKFFRREEHLMTVEEKALVLGDSASGGIIVPNERSSRLIEKVVEVSPVRKLATVMVTTGNNLEIVKETGQMSASWTSEQGTLTEDTATRFGLETIPVHAQNALVKVSRQMLADSPMDIEAFLMSRAALKFGKGEGTAFLTGNGVGRPQGILATPGGTAIISGTQSTSGASGQFIPDDVMDCEASLISTYAKGATWLFTRATLNFIRKFRDSEGRFLNLVTLDQLRAIEGGGRGMIVDGYPVEEAVDLNELASAAKVGIFANFAELYTVVDRQNMVVIRDPFSSKTTGLVDYLFERRVGGQVVQADAGKYLQCKA